MLQSLMSIIFESIFKENKSGNLPILFIVILFLLVFLIYIVPKMHTYLSYDSFDIYLMHKRRHSPIQLTKKITLLLVGTFLFLAIYLILGFVLSKSHFFLNLFLIFSAVFIILFLIYMLFFVLFQLFKFKFFTNRKIKFEIFSYILFFSTISLLGIIGASILFTSFEFTVNDTWAFSLQSLVNEKNATDSDLSIYDISFILISTSVFPTLFMTFMKPHKKDNYELVAIIENRLPRTFKLHLNYVIDNETTVLFNSEKNIKAIKRNFENNFVIEIYKKIT